VPPGTGLIGMVVVFVAGLIAVSRFQKRED
jgi:hypothetical protein